MDSHSCLPTHPKPVCCWGLDSGRRAGAEPEAARCESPALPLPCPPCSPPLPPASQPPGTGRDDLDNCPVSFPCLFSLLEKECWQWLCLGSSLGKHDPWCFIFQLFREVRIMKVLNHPNIGENQSSFHSSPTSGLHFPACHPPPPPRHVAFWSLQGRLWGSPAQRPALPPAHWAVLRNVAALRGACPWEAGRVRGERSSLGCPCTCWGSMCCPSRLSDSWLGLFSCS